jgi:hypothetical protein
MLAAAEPTGLTDLGRNRRYRASLRAFKIVAARQLVVTA